MGKKKSKDGDKEVSNGQRPGNNANEENEELLQKVGKQGPPKLQRQSAVNTVPSRNRPKV